MSIQGAIDGAITRTVGSAIIVKKLQEDSPSQVSKRVNKEVQTLMKTAESGGVSKDWSKSIYNKMENLEGQYPLVQFPDGYLKAKTSLAKKIREKNLQQEAVKQKRQSYLDQPTSIGGTLRDLNLSSEQKKSVRAQLKGGK